METARPFQPEDLSTIREWWLARGDGALPPEILPPDGVVVTGEDGGLVASGFAYFPTGAAVVMLDWFVVRPGMRAHDTRRALRAVLAALERLARSRGTKWAMGATPYRAFAREALACGFSEAGPPTIHLVKQL